MFLNRNYFYWISLIICLLYVAITTKFKDLKESVKHKSFWQGLALVILLPPFVVLVRLLDYFGFLDNK